MMDGKPLSNKERIELFQSSVSKLTSEMDVTSVRDLLRQRYLKAKEEEDEEKRKRQEEAERLKKNEDNDSSDKVNNNNSNKKSIGKQLARIFRFKNSSRRQTVANQNRNREQNRPEIDPFDDPNVLFENFGFHNDQEMMGDDDAIAMLDDDDQNGDDEDEINDSFSSLIRTYCQSWTFADVAILFTKLMIYISGQYVANRYGFGAPYFIIALLVLICTNLRKKRPGELSAYSVFNPDCRPIPGVASSDQPDNTILLGFGNL